MNRMYSYTQQNDFNSKEENTQFKPDLKATFCQQKLKIKEIIFF